MMRVGRVSVLAAALAAALTAVPARAEPDAGAYLAARAALRSGDFTGAATYLLTAIVADPDNPALVNSALAAYVGTGQIGAAAPLAERAIAEGWRSQLANMVHVATLTEAGDWAGILADLDAGRSVSQLTDGLTRGWALIGAGDIQAGLAAFDAVADTRGMRPFGLYLKALALASAGDYEGADAIFAMAPEQGMIRSRRSVLAHAQVLSQLGRAGDAVALIDASFPGGADPVLDALRSRLAAGETVPWTFVRNARDGLAETYYTVAGAIVDETEDSNVLFHGRIALALRPDFTEARLLVAQILDRLEQYDLARAAFAEIPPDDPAFAVAELGRAEALRKLGELSAGTEVLDRLARDRPDFLPAQIRLADFLRLGERTDEAIAAYDRAIALTPAGDPTLWRLYYARGTLAFRQDDWTAAEADFTRALDLSPDQPAVLNFYGYSLLERGEKLDQALEMVRRATDADPQNGAIVDSLGWAYYRLGRLPEAVETLERAVALEPGDATINDHLGDAYWAVGRAREARFQWSRALSFDPAEADAERIRAKLDHGLLDAAQPVDMAGSGG